MPRDSTTRAYEQGSVAGNCSSCHRSVGRGVVERMHPSNVDARDVHVRPAWRWRRRRLGHCVALRGGWLAGPCSIQCASKRPTPPPERMPMEFMPDTTPGRQANGSVGGGAGLAGSHEVVANLRRLAYTAANATQLSPVTEPSNGDRSGVKLSGPDAHARLVGGGGLAGGCKACHRRDASCRR